MLPVLPDTQLARWSLFLNVSRPAGHPAKKQKAVPGSSDGPWSTAGSAASLVWRKADDGANRNKAGHPATRNQAAQAAQGAAGTDDTRIRRQDEAVHAVMLCSPAIKVKFIIF